MFFLLPIGVEYRASRQPVVTYTIGILCILLWLLGLMIEVGGGETAFDAYFDGLALIPAHSGPHAWITLMFMHGGVFHLVGNLIYLYLFGACIEDILGRWQFVVFYLAGGLFSTLLHVLMSAKGFQSEVSLVGASGAISACMGAFAVLLWRAKIEFRFVYWFLFAVGAREWFLPSWLVLSVWFLEDVLGMAETLGHSGGGTAFAAHVGGFLAGAAVGGILKARGWHVDLDDAPIGPEARPSLAVPKAAAIPADTRAVFVWSQGRQVGPFGVDQVAAMRETGALAEGDMFWDDATQAWRPLDDLSMGG